MMATNYGERYNFEAEWYDKVAFTLKKFYLYYYPGDNTIELFDIKTRKTYLRRTNCEGIHENDIYVGAIVTIFSRSIKITDYADIATKNKLENKVQRTFALLKPDVVDKMGEILKQIINHNLQITNIRMINLTKDIVSEMYKTKNSLELLHITDYLTSGPVVAVELLGEKAIAKWRELVGISDGSDPPEKALNSLRASYGKDEIHNAVHGPATAEAAEKELELFFPKAKGARKWFKNTATLKNCTCCIIKPHAVQARLAADIVNDIQKAGYTISAKQMFYVNSTNAEEFLEVYKGVLPEYSAMVSELHSGPCIAMEIIHKDETVDVHAEFRKFCGPIDPDIAKKIRPDTLRAKYGKSKVQNAVHCSDLPEDGLLEVEYFFKILDSES